MDNNFNNSGMLPVGTILHGKYRVDGYLASGGFGNTYVATDISFDKKVAVKEFFLRGVSQRDDNSTTVSVSNPDSKATFTSQREKFKKEALRLYNLDNPHIVHVYDLFEENNTAYYSMDYIDGPSLKQKLNMIGHGMPEKSVRKILSQLLDALECIHDNGIFHLDLKPANIMLGRDGVIRLIDFGASKQQSTGGGVTATSAIAYTNGYAPREQMEQNPNKFGPWTDFYALGATLYNLLTNRKPPLPTDIDDDTSTDKHVALPMPSTVSDKTKKLVLWMMATNRKKRPQSVSEILGYLSKTDNGDHSSSYSFSTSDSEETVVKGSGSSYSSSNNGTEIPIYRSISSNGLTWTLVSITLGTEYSIFKWKVYCDESYAYIYNEGTEYVIDKAYSKKYRILKSDGIGTPTNPTILVKDYQAVEFTEYFQPLSPSVRSIDYHMGGDNVIKDIDLAGNANSNIKYTIDSIPLQKGISLSQLEETAQQQGDTGSLYFLGLLYLTGKMVKKDYSKAVKWFRAGALKGDASAQAALATRYYNGEGVTQDYYQAVSWYRKAAEQEEPPAQYMLGLCYYNGDGVAQNYAEAAKWYKKAAKQGYDDAEYMIGFCYYQGKGVAQDYEQAFNWFRSAANKENVNAMQMVGMCYYLGNGAPLNYSAAVPWFRKSADQGNPSGQFMLGECYYNGRGVSQNYYTAVQWYRKAADQDDPDAQIMLGICYENGQGVSQNFEQSRKWYQKAANAGDENAAEALKNLGRYSYANSDYEVRSQSTTVAKDADTEEDNGSLGCLGELVYGTIQNVLTYVGVIGGIMLILFLINKCG